jgi:diguanylate cyclase (GGDEF)-like protein
MDSRELDENWKRACRTDELTRRFPEPLDPQGLVGHVLARVRGEAHPPDAILAGAATGFASADYQVSGEAKYVQLAMLVQEAAKDPLADGTAALRVLAVVGQAAAGLLLTTWRGEAEVDDLTRLGNRRKMEAEVREFMSSSSRFAYASIDADGLKQVNDSFGHDAGDSMLREIAVELQRTMQEFSGEAFRYGGDEFGTLMAVPATAETLTEVLTTAQTSLSLAGRPFSFGVAVWPDDDSDAATVTKLADRRMYEQKKVRKRSVEAAEGGS